MTTTEATWSALIATLRRRLHTAPPGGSLDDLYQAIGVAHRAASQLQTVGVWNQDLRCTDAAFHLNLAEAALREALSERQWTARPTGLSDFADDRARDIAEKIADLLDGVQRALAEVIHPGGALASSLAASRASMEVAQARRALGDELRR
jgi:hypothetical protein